MSGRPERHSNASDTTLMEAIRNGSETALRTLLDRYWARLATYAERIVGDRDDAKDVVQRVFIRVWVNRTAWTSKGSPSAFLYRVTRNFSLNARRDSKAQALRDETGGQRLADAGSELDPQEKLEVSTLREEVEAAISKLPSRRREVFVLSRFHGLTHREIAEALDLAPQTVANHMTSALAELRERLAHHFEEE